MQRSSILGTSMLRPFWLFNWYACSNLEYVGFGYIGTLGNLALFTLRFGIGGGTLKTIILVQKFHQKNYDMLRKTVNEISLNFWVDCYVFWWQNFEATFLKPEVDNLEDPF